MDDRIAVGNKELDAKWLRALMSGIDSIVDRELKAKGKYESFIGNYLMKSENEIMTTRHI
jgi:hypothetical protein